MLYTNKIVILFIVSLINYMYKPYKYFYTLLVGIDKVLTICIITLSDFQDISTKGFNVTYSRHYC